LELSMKQSVSQFMNIIFYGLRHLFSALESAFTVP
jgi:hypothetical protein